MSDPSFSNTVNGVKRNLQQATEIERDWWNEASHNTRRSILVGKDVDYLIGSENAYQQDYTAKFNQIISTNYDSLPATIKSTISETLIVQGELPNPSDFKGIGLEFVANPWATEKEVFTECDRCDEVFLADEDFEEHKNIDHGDLVDGSNEAEQDNVEDSYLASMNPDASKESIIEARRLLGETDEGDLHRSVYFNGDELPKVTASLPDMPKGKVGYNDNPNEGLYDTKIFKTGTSEDRVALEAEGEEDEETRYSKAQLKSMQGIGSKYDEHHSPNESEPTEIISGDSPEDNDTTYYDESQTIGSIALVKTDKEGESRKINALENIDFSPEKVQYIYKTKGNESDTNDHDDSELDKVIKNVDEEYGDDDIESDEVAVEAQIIDRKLRGYNNETIARELVIQYGVPHEQAYERSVSVEVSVNDKVANTFFGKRYSECNEAEINELRLYGGSD